VLHLAESVDCASEKTVVDFVTLKAVFCHFAELESEVDVKLQVKTRIELLHWLDDTQNNVFLLLRLLLHSILIVTSDVELLSRQCDRSRLFLCGIGIF